MRRRKEEYKQNNFNGNVNFTGKTQIAAGDIINNISEEKQKTANYDPEPKWRSPFTLAVLTWISTIIAIVGIFPFAKIVKSIVCFFRGMNGNTISLDMQKYSIIFIIFVFLFFSIKKDMIKLRVYIKEKISAVKLKKSLIENNKKPSAEKVNSYINSDNVEEIEQKR